MHPAEHARPAVQRVTMDEDGWHELEVENPSFLIVKLGAECGDLQGLRELTVNGLEAIAALGPASQGRVVWDLDWERFEASGGRVRKLSVIDTGVGMSAGQMRYYINHLAASSHQQTRTGNFGVGAKIAAGSRNPAGLEYRSWRDGQGALICFKRHHDGRWGLQPQTWPDGHTDFWRALEEHEKPWLLRGRPNGTQVVLLGEHDRQDTTQAPASVTEARQQWITRYLNTRFLSLPDQVEVLVRDRQRAGADWRDPGALRRIYGQRRYLEPRTEQTGTVELSDAFAHWWVLDDDHRARRREAGIWAATGHAAAVFDDELYDLLAQTRGGYGRLQDFGVRFGYERVVIYLEPQGDGRLEANTARTLLLLDQQPLPWARWGEEFAAAMPEEILRLQERVASADGIPRREAIRGRVSQLLPLYSLSRYRPPQPAGHLRVEHPPTQQLSTPPSETQPDADHRGLDAGSEAPTTPDTPPERGPVGEPDNVGEAIPEPIADLPDVAWISTRDGTRAAGDLEDQAARYHLERHELTINADFRVITDMTAHWRRRYEGTPGARPVIEAQVREWFEQVLIEVVLSARNSRWDGDQLVALLSPTSFSAALLPRHLLHAMLQKRLAQKLGAPRD